MGERGPQPTGVPFEELSDSIQRQCFEAITARPLRSAQRLFEDLGLTRHGVSVHAWKRMVMRIRNKQRRLGTLGEYPEGPAEETIDEKGERLTGAMLDYAERCLRAGDVKPHQFAQVIRAMHERQKERVRSDANRRAEEKFKLELESKLREQHAKASAVLKKAGVSRETLDEIDTVYGIAPGDGDGHR